MIEPHIPPKHYLINIGSNCDYRIIKISLLKNKKESIKYIRIMHDGTRERDGASNYN